jgi:AraC-like DNA-binding protein
VTRHAINRRRGPTPDLAARSLVPEGMVRIAPTMGVPALLREHGVDPEPLLAEFDLTPAQFGEPEYTLSFHMRSRLLARCAQATRCPHFGLLLGQRAGLSSFGLLGYLMQSAPDLRTALTLGVRNFRLHNPNSTSALVVHRSLATVSHTPFELGVEGRAQVIDLSVGIMLSTVHTLRGPGAHPIEVRIAHARPRSVAPFKEFARAPVIFDAPDTAVVIPASWLDQPLPTADPMLHQLMQHRVAELQSQAGEAVAAQLRRILPALIDARSAVVPEAAARLGIGARTLNRRLAAEGTTFARLRDETRHSMAAQLLRGTRLQAAEIAEKLGYANASAFTTAFRRWSGQPPSQWRASGLAAES